MKKTEKIHPEILEKIEDLKTYSELLMELGKRIGDIEKREDKKTIIYYLEIWHETLKKIDRVRLIQIICKLNFNTDNSKYLKLLEKV